MQGKGSDGEVLGREGSDNGQARLLGGDSAKQQG